MFDERKDDEFFADMGEILSDEEKRALGIVSEDPEVERVLDGKVMNHMTALMENGDPNLFGQQELTPIKPLRAADAKTLKPYQGKESDAEIMFNFEDWEDAQTLYDFIIESGLLEPGEVVLRHDEGQNGVHFQPHVLVMKPDVIHAAMIAYQDVVLEDSADVFNEITDGIGLVLTEVVKTSGAPKRKPRMGNPFHDKDSGKFTGAQSSIDSKGGGSWAIGKTKLKYTGAKKSKKGDLIVNFGSTKHPCGRAAREKGKDIRCWDGKEGAGFKIARLLGKKKRRESMDVFDQDVLNEVQAEFNARTFFED
jgi:hypothetical protein